MIISLIGYRGSGKSAVAQPLAERLGWAAVDADDLIEQRAGSSIADIFAQHGEPVFRQQERAVMTELLAKDRLVIATGGGAILNEQTRNEMKTAGPVIWLQAPPHILQQRITNDPHTAQRRPALTQQSQSQQTEIETILAQREPLYRRCASLIIPTDSQTVPEIVEQIINTIDAELSEG